jgi:HPt (histidine-containing phosphotransfer) domain-containing protein
MSLATAPLRSHPRDAEMAPFPDVSALPVLDGELVDELCRLAPLCDKDFLQSLLGEFAQSAGQSIGAMRAGVLARDAKAIGNAAHRLRGASSSLGAVRLSRACIAVEKTLRGSHGALNLEMLQSTVDEALEALRIRFARE